MAFSGFAPAALAASVPTVEVAPSEAGSLPAEPSLKEFAKHVKVPAPLAAALAEGLGGGEDMLLEDFAFMAEDAVKRVAENITLEGVALTELQRAQVNRLFHRARQSAAGAGLPVPGVIAPVTTTVQLMLKQSAYIDQSSEATFPFLGPAEIRKHRDVYKDFFGAEPPTAKRATDEQLSAFELPSDDDGRKYQEEKPVEDVDPG